MDRYCNVEIVKVLLLGDIDWGGAHSKLKQSDKHPRQQDARHVGRGQRLRFCLNTAVQHISSLLFTHNSANGVFTRKTSPAVHCGGQFQP